MKNKLFTNMQAIEKYFKSKIFRSGLSQREQIFYLEVPNELICLKFTPPLQDVS